MAAFYDLIALLIALFYAPIYLLRRKFHQGFRQRLGFLPKGPRPSRPIWVHAVSLGEAKSIRGLLENLRRRYPQKQFVISTVTPTGNKIARDMASPQDLVIYLPLDFSFIVGAVLARLDPAVFIIAETEIWPNLICRLKRRGTPVVIVNGRVSDRSLGGYRAIKFLLRPVLRKISLFCVQTDADARRFAELGVEPGKIRVSGNLKFDLADNHSWQEEAPDYRLRLKMKGGEKLWVAGSTHPGEEKLLLMVYRQLLADHPGLRLLIAPRHPERSQEVESLVRRFGFLPGRVSLLGVDGGSGEVLILDSVGGLMHYYAAADLVFIGGSLVRIGGHNILEPALLAKPVIFGPQMFNFRDIAGMFLAAQAAVMVNNPAQLRDKLRWLLENPSAAEELGRRGRSLILANRGATRKTAQEIESLFFRIQNP